MAYTFFFLITYLGSDLIILFRNLFDDFSFFHSEGNSLFSTSMEMLIVQQLQAQWTKARVVSI